MTRRTTDLSAPARDGYDALIDVRSPGEFAEDRLPGAINLPVLDDAERASIGTEYVQGSKFLARRTGAALVARNIAAHLDGALAERGGGFKALVYCWRGGQRSGAMVAVMDQVGWPITVLEGGYQTWRRQVVAALYDAPLSHRLILVDGPTGAGKTRLLEAVARLDGQAIDLEALAGHRGSLFGMRPGGQPSQRAFESGLHDALTRLDPARPVFVEAESSRIGERVLPPSLWRAMQDAPTLLLEAPMEVRVARIVADYADIAADPAALDEALTRLPRHHARTVIGRWREMATAGQIAELAAELMARHYDPAWTRAAQAQARPPLMTLRLDEPTSENLGRIARTVIDALDPEAVRP